MSYRGIKRVLGETKLELKCRLLFGLCLLVLITTSFWWYGSRVEQQMTDQNRRNGRGLVDAVNLLNHWESLAKKKEDEEGLVDLMRESFQNQKYNWRIIKPNSASGAGQPQDEFEVNLLKDWDRPLAIDSDEEVPELEWSERRIPDEDEKTEYHYYQAIRYKSECIDCHNNFGPTGATVYDAQGIGDLNVQVGELAAIVKVSVSDEKSQQARKENQGIFFATAIVTVGLVMIALYVIVRYIIFKPLKHLRDISDAVSRGDMNLRADIHTGDEFEDMADAFNRMLRHVAATQNELRDLNGNLDQKIDELAQVNMRLHEMNRLKSDFLATMSHELRTPLNSILGFSEVLQTIESLDDKQVKYVNNIQTSGRVLLEMINDILDLAKIESGKMEIRLSNFRIDAIISAQCDMARPLAEKKNIEMEVRVDKELPELHQDQAKIQQILNNLLSNAIKFTPEGGRICVVAERAPFDQFILIVQDTGVGIAEDDQRTIFEKFRQGSSGPSAGDAITREYSGTGLGLSIVKEMCKLLGGEINLESDLGHGSTFTVSLPCRLSDRPRLDSPLSSNSDQLTQPRRGGLPVQFKNGNETVEPEMIDAKSANPKSDAAP